MQKQDQAFKAKAKRFGGKLFRFGTVFSVFTVVMSLFSGLGTHLANRFTGGEQVSSSEQSQKTGLLPYESPSFHVFDSVYINPAKATVNIAT